MSNAEFPLPGPPRTPERQAAPERKLLNETMTGAQQELLLADHASASEEQKMNVVHEIAAGKAPSSKKTTKGSYHERDTYWTGDKSKYKNKTYDENMVVWEKKMDKYLGSFKDKTGDKEFFRRIGIDIDQGADAQTVYEIFMDKHNGDVGYYADTIAQNFTPEEIEHHKALIQTFSNMYGENSSKVATLLAEGIKNIRKNKAKFIKSAKENINRADQMPGRDIVTTMTEQAALWDKRPIPEPQRQPAAQPRRPDSPSPGPEPAHKEKETQFDIKVGGESVEGNKGKNEDRIWFDKKTGAAILCDGMGGHGNGAEAAQIITESLSRFLSNIPTFKTSERAMIWLKDEILKADFQLGEAKKNRLVTKDAGTTLIASFIWNGPNGEHELITGNVGDSRISAIMDDSIIDVTYDQSSSIRYHAKMTADTPPKLDLDMNGYAQLDNKRPRTTAEIKRLQTKFSTIKDPEKDLNDEEYGLWQMRNRLEHAVLGNVRIDDVIELNHIAIRPGDSVLLRSDGLTDVLTNNQTLQITRGTDDPDMAAQLLNAKAKQEDTGLRTKGTPDDKSVIVIKILERAEDPDEPSPTSRAYWDKYLKPMTELDLDSDDFKRLYISEGGREKYIKHITAQLKYDIDHRDEFTVKPEDTVGYVLRRGLQPQLLQRIMLLKRANEATKTTEELANMRFSEFAGEYLGMDLPENYEKTFITPHNATLDGETEKQIPQVDYAQAFVDPDGNKYTVISPGKDELPLAIRGPVNQLFLGPAAEQILQNSTLIPEPDKVLTDEGKTEDRDEALRQIGGEIAGGFKVIGERDAELEQQLTRAAYNMRRPLNREERNFIAHGGSTEELMQLVNVKWSEDFQKGMNEIDATRGTIFRFRHDSEVSLALHRMNLDGLSTRLLTPQIAGFEKALELGATPSYILNITKTAEGKLIPTLNLTLTIPAGAERENIINQVTLARNAAVLPDVDGEAPPDTDEQRKKMDKARSDSLDEKLQGFNALEFEKFRSKLHSDTEIEDTLREWIDLRIQGYMNNKRPDGRKHTSTIINIIGDEWLARKYLATKDTKKLSGDQVSELLKMSFKKFALDYLNYKVPAAYDETFDEPDTSEKPANQSGQRASSETQNAAQQAAGEVQGDGGNKGRRRLKPAIRRRAR